jgi:hypothetical protein
MLRKRLSERESLHRLWCVVAMGLVILFGLAGCQTSAHSTDSRLRKMDEMLASELPKGTNMARVSYFLSSRGFRTVPATKPQTIIAIVRQIDTDTLRPANARVTFHFDARDQLESYEMTTAPDELPHP